MLTITLKVERETTNTIRYAAVDDVAECVAPVIYLKKRAVEALGNPAAIDVVIGATGAFDEALEDES